VVLLTLPIFVCATVDLEKILHGIPSTAINNVADDGLLLIAPTVLEDTLRLRPGSVSSICHSICYNVGCITY